MKKLMKTISNEKATSIIFSPIMTEKSTNLNQFNKYSFVVSRKSTSSEIKQAIETVFKVKVEKINTEDPIPKAKKHIIPNIRRKIETPINHFFDSCPTFRIIFFSMSY